MNRTSLLSGGLLLGAMLATALPEAQAQTAERRTALSANVGLMQYNGNMGTDFWDLGRTDFRVGGGGGITRYMSPSIDLGLYGYYETFRFSADADKFPGSSFESRTGFVDFGVKLKLNNGKILKEDARIQPYLMVGGGAFLANSYGTVGLNGSTTNFFNQIRRLDSFAAAGLRFRITPALSADLQTSQHYPFTDRVDNLVAPTDKFYDRFLVHTLGLTYALPGPKDTDGDGVKDKLDKCPNTPKGVAVDLVGCPLDRDMDTVPDYLDKCPDEKGVVALDGCPDRDNDGIRDADDECPDEAGKAEFKGCPDTDNDGVINKLDQCPTTPAGVKVDAKGCPLDRDGDTVPDYQDKCPDRAGPASNKGCPEIKEETKKRLSEATKFIQFEYNKATLKSASFPTLEQLAVIMAEYPDYTMGISAHADNKGADNYNLRLSDDRAASARTFMLSKGVPAERIVSHGYGETKPIGDNKTDAGRALNRRVEFDLYLTGEPNASEVKYGPAPTIQPEAPKPAAPVKKAPVRKARRR